MALALWTEDDYGSIADKSCWFMFGVLTILIALRLFCRIKYAAGGVVGGLGLDDLITVICWLVFLTTCVLVTIGTHYGLGRHMLTLDKHEIPKALEYNVIISSVLIWSFSLPKFAIVALLQRILSFGTKTAVLFWGLALSSQACIFATSVWWYKQCDPVEYGWNRAIPGTCADVSVLANLGYFTSAYSAFLDIFFALYPIPLIMRLNMPMKARVTISVAMGLSVLACVVSIYKLAIFGSVFEILPNDPTYPVAYLDILGMAEGFILLVCASIPTLGPIFRIVRGKVTTVRSSGRNSTGESKQGGRSALSKDSRHKNKKLHSDTESQPEENWYGVDEIPLVSSTTQRAANSGIHKDMEVAVWSEARTASTQPTTRASQGIYQGP